MFSALAFAGIIFTIFLQKRELKLQREEMEKTRREFTKQNETLTLQKLENTFFQLINLFYSIVNILDIQDVLEGQVTATGRDCFEIFYEHFLNVAKSKAEHIAHIESVNDTSISIAIHAYNEFYNENKSDLSHYFRTLYHTIKFIENSNIEDKKQYTSIVRAQLSSYEQILLFYNCCHLNGYKKFKPLIEKYKLLKNIDSSLILNKEHLKEYSSLKR